MLMRLLRLLISGAGALALALLLNGVMAGPVAAGAGAASAAGPAIITGDTFSATALLTAGAGSVAVGDSITVTAQLVKTGTCRFAIYDVTLRGVGSQFRFVDPPGSVIGPPGENPAAWRLAAVQSGAVTFTVSFYGETYCDGVWQWTLVESEPQRVAVTPALVALPYVSRDTPPVPVTDLAAARAPPGRSTSVGRSPAPATPAAASSTPSCGGAAS